MAVRLLIADDHEVVRSGLVGLLSDSDVEVVAQASTVEEAVRLACEHRPDVALLDIRMNDDDGLSALDQIHRDLPDTRVIMLSAYDNPTYMARARALGASDYLLKGADREQLLATIHEVVESGGPSQHGELRHVAGQMDQKHKSTPDEDPLTQREIQVLRHVALGLSNKEIARSLDISVETVKEHVQHVLRKIGVTDRTQAAVWAVRRQIV